MRDRESARQRGERETDSKTKRLRQTKKEAQRVTERKREGL